MTVAKELLIRQLRAMGADGLCNGSLECGCSLDDLAPGGDECLCLDECEAARITGTDDEYGLDCFGPLLQGDTKRCFWDDYQADQSFENGCRWMKHRAYMRSEGGCRK